MSDPFATYRPAGLRGLDAVAAGVCHYSALAVLQQRDEAITAKLDALVAEAEGKKGAAAQLAALKASEPERDRLMEERRNIAAQISAETARRDRERNEPAGGMTEEDLVASLERSGRKAGEGASGGPATSALYADVFGKPKAAEGFDSFDEYLRVIHSGLSDQRVQAAMGERVGSDGGFLVPEQFTAELLDSSLEDEIVRPRARVYGMTSDTRKIAGLDDQADHTSTIYGLRGRWLEESGTSTDQKAKIRLLKLTAHKLGIFAMSSNELVEDGLSFEEQLGTAMRASIAFDLDDAFLNGNGVAKPLGVLNDPATVTVAKETGQAADTINYDNLKKMFARMYPAGRRKAVWVVNTDAIPELLSLTQVVGTGGVVIPVMSESSDGTFRILTRPVIFTEKVPGVGDLGDISFVDFSQYAIGMRKEATLDRSAHVGWHEDETGYRTILRADGRGTWKAPLVPRKGGATLSWAVTLAARA